MTRDLLGLHFEGPFWGFLISFGTWFKVFFPAIFVWPVHCLCRSWWQRAAHCTDPNPCLHPPCTREVWVLTAALLMVSHPIATASPATPILSWALQHPATTWTLSATGSPHRSVQQVLPQYICKYIKRSHIKVVFTFVSLPPPLLLSLFRICNCIWLKLKFRSSMFSKITASVGFYVRLPKPWIYFSYSKLLHL